MATFPGPSLTADELAVPAALAVRDLAAIEASLRLGEEPVIVERDRMRANWVKFDVIIAGRIIADVRWMNGPPDVVAMAPGFVVENRKAVRNPWWIHQVDEATIATFGVGLPSKFMADWRDLLGGEIDP